MRRETVVNSVIVVLLVAGSVPGAIRIWNKKMARPTPAGSLEGAAARRDVPYMEPLAATFARTVPPTTAGWAAWQGGDLLGVPGVGGAHVSAARRFEVVAVDGDRAAVLVWDEQLGRQLAGAGEVVDVPASVRDELRAAGFVTPPTWAVRLVAPVEGGRVTLGTGEAADVAELP